MINKILNKIKIFFYRKKLEKIKKAKISTLSFKKDLILGKNCIIGKNVLIERNVKIGDNTYISSDTTIDSNVTIGKYCSIAKNVFIAPGVHNYNYVTTHPILFNPYWRKKLNIKENTKYDVSIGKENETTTIGNDVWIALNVIIMRGVNIGDGAIIAAGAIVTKDVEPYSIVAGNPAKHIKYRFDKENIEKIMKANKKWWNLSEDELDKLLPNMYDVNKYLKFTTKKETNSNGKES